MIRPHLLAAKVALFAVLSLLDLFMTWQLLQASGGTVYESNPFADWWLEHTGWSGLAAFKGAAVLAVSVVSLAIARSRPKLAHGIPSFGCALLMGVLFHSAGIAHRLDESTSFASELALAQRQEHSLDTHLELAASHQVAMQKLAAKLRAGKLDLQAAVEAVAESGIAQDSRWRKAIRGQYPSGGWKECLAAYIIDFTVCGNTNPNPEELGATVARLTLAYETQFGEPPQQCQCLRDWRRWH